MKKTEARIYGVEQKHCKPRIIERFGIKDPAKQKAWVNEALQNCVKVDGPDDRGRSVYVHFTEPIRIVVNEIQGLAVTVIDEGAEGTKMSSTYLSGVLSVMLRERRRLEKDYKRSTRKLELQHAEAYAESARLMMNRAKAGNPKTRELLKERIAAQEELIAGINEQAAEDRRQYVIAKVKIESFLRTTNPNEEGAR